MTISAIARDAMRPTTAHMPALDGLRGWAVLLVMVYHSEILLDGRVTRLLTGGWIGVDIFFVLSGYLITRGLLRPLSGAKPLRHFYARRLRRLGPAVLVLLVVWLVLSLFGVIPAVWVGHPAQTQSLALVLAPVVGLLTLSYNWWAGFDLPQPYGMGQLWSLTVEEQFYLVWPGVMRFATQRLRHAIRYLFAGCCGICCISLIFIEWATLAGEQRIAYFSTPVRMFGLAVGAAIALEQAEGAKSGAPRTRWLGNAVGAVGLALLAILSIKATDQQVFLVPVISLGAGMVVWSVASDDRIGRTWLRWRWLRWCGRRSYALYLWHPFCLMAWHHALGRTWLGAAVGAMSAFGCAALSWQFVEARFLRGRATTNDVDRTTLARQPGRQPVAVGGPRTT